MRYRDDAPGAEDEVILVPAPGTHNQYWIPAADVQTKTLARALFELLLALLGLGFRVLMRVLAIAFVVVMYAAIFFAALLVFGVLFAVI
jgi:hypothetical protein